MAHIHEIERQIEITLRKDFEPSYLEVQNESAKHNVPEGSETHFKVTLVSPFFENQSLVTRHRSVYKALDAFIKGGVHALALHVFTVSEWEKREGSLKSPPCLGEG